MAGLQLVAALVLVVMRPAQYPAGTEIERSTLVATVVVTMPVYAVV
jgi:hypothetical protein